MKLLWMELRRLTLPALVRGVSIAFLGLLVVLYARLSGIYSLLGAVRLLLPSLSSVLMDLLYLYCFLFSACWGARTLCLAEAGEHPERLAALPLSREQLALSRLGARMLTLALFAFTSAGVLALGAAGFAGAAQAAIFLRAAALRFPALLCAFCVGFAFSGLCVRYEYACLGSLLTFFALHGVALCAFAGLLPSALLYLSPVFTFSSSQALLPALLWAAASLACIPVSLVRFGRRDLL